MAFVTKLSAGFYGSILPVLDEYRYSQRHGASAGLCACVDDRSARRTADRCAHRRRVLPGLRRHDLWLPGPPARAGEADGPAAPGGHAGGVAAGPAGPL